MLFDALLLIGLFWLVYMAAVVSHEACHAIAGRLVGGRVHTFVVGGTPPLVAFLVGRVHVALGWRFWEGGHTLVTLSSPAHYRRRMWLVTASAPAFNVAVCAIAWWCAAPIGLEDFTLVDGTPWFGWLLLTHGVTAVTSLWPRRSIRADLDWPSDGAELLTLPRLDDDEVAERIAEDAEHAAWYDEAAARGEVADFDA